MTEQEEQDVMERFANFVVFFPPVLGIPSVPEPEEEL